MVGHYGSSRTYAFGTKRIGEDAPRDLSSETMKRYRVFPIDFDARVHSLREIPDHWEEDVKELHRQNRSKTERALVHEFGERDAEAKRQSFIDLGPKPLSVLAFHNRFLEQVRHAFVIGANYPALTAACALGERILNHLVLTLRDEFKNTAEYKRVYNKDSFDNWDLPINTLAAWDILLPDVVVEFRTLRDLRNGAIHFRPELDTNDRALALGAIKSLKVIVSNQFGAFGQQPWFMSGVPGECYIKKAWEQRPFIRSVYLPNCGQVGPRHVVTSVMPWRVVDAKDYDDRDVSDDEFCTLRLAGQRNPVAI